LIELLKLHRKSSKLMKPRSKANNKRSQKQYRVEPTQCLLIHPISKRGKKMKKFMMLWRRKNV
jgi:hypothetical protein